MPARRSADHAPDPGANEGLVVGPGAVAWFAQPSGPAATTDRLWLTDSETSVLRWATSW